MQPRHDRRERGISLFLGTMSLVFIVPLMGLIVDVGIMYSAKSRLQAAVDGAALAAARALVLGQTTASQSAAAKQNAVNWFYANFPPGNWATNGTVMNTGTVLVQDDPNNPNLRNVTVTATTTVPTWFMRFFNVPSTAFTVTGNASRRDVVAMIVLDRSGSMCKGGSNPCSGSSSTPCGDMVKAAKLFTGQFAENRDYIGLVSFSDNTYVHSAPTQTFQTTLGYTNDFGSASGQIDSISCNGGTGTAEAVSMAYQLLYQTNLPGALNLILLETDGLPNTLTMNFWDNGNTVTGLKNTSGCTDTAGHTVGGTPHGFTSSAVIPSWTSGLALNASPFMTSHAFFSNIPAGMIGAVASTDPGGGNSFFLMLDYWSTSGQSQSSGTASHPFNSTTYLSTANSCGFNGGQVTGSPGDINWFPQTDVFSNNMNPSYGYQTVTTDGQGHITQNGWSNYHNAVLNATENSAYQVRTNAILPAYFFAIGLGGNSALGPPDPVLLQRMANDPSGDTFNSPAQYAACASETACATFSSQPQGSFIYALNTSTLGQAFLRISSQVLRLSK